MAINGSLGSGEVIDNAVESLLAATGLSSGVVYWFDRTQELLIGRGAKGFRNGLRPGIDVHGKTSGSLPSRAFRASEPLLFNADDPRTGYASVTEDERRCIVPEEIRTAAFVKIGSGAAAHGVLALCAHGFRWKIDADWVELLSMVAGQLETALERAKSHEAVSERADEIANLYEIGRRLDGFDGGAALSGALEFACHSFGFTRCTVDGLEFGATDWVDALPVGHRLAVPLAVGNYRMGQLVIDCGKQPGAREWRLGRAIAELVSIAAWRHHHYRKSKQAGAAEVQGRLAREIHDGIAQRFYVIQLNLTAAADSVDEPENHQHYLDQAMRNSQLGLEESRQWVRSLRQPQGSHRRLGEDLAVLADEFVANFGIPCELSVLGPEGVLDESTHQAVMRGVQELLHNVGKHADAANVHVGARFGAGHLEVTVVDDGRGIEDTRNGGFGLLGIRERMTEVGARLFISGRRGRGTTAALRVPLLDPMGLPLVPSTTTTWPTER
ncbi:GAF domain-containing sensor histidine kinase [Pseudonocardia hispaniensis]|uniref:histidine kinase n=1 Tax=Pseudonocardia hispaniensis TaxID=904933 RepID=A0ABW1J3S2_9PSEU